MSSAHEGFLESVNNLVLDPGRVLDLTEDKWGHPEATSPWSIDPAVAPTLTILSPDAPPGVRAQVGGMLQLVPVIAEKNIHDFFEYDLSRPWVCE